MKIKIRNQNNLIPIIFIRIGDNDLSNVHFLVFNYLQLIFIENTSSEKIQGK